MQSTNTHSRSVKLAMAAALTSLFFGTALAQFPPGPTKPKSPWMDRTLGPDKRADLVIEQMTLDEKISMLHGNGWLDLMAGPDGPATKSLGGSGYIPGIPRLGIPDLQIAYSSRNAIAGSMRSDLRAGR